MKQIDMAKIQVACLLDFHTGGRHIRIPRSHTWGRASSGWSTNKEGIILQAHLWSALLHIRGNEFHRNFVVSDQRIHRNFVVSENLPFKGYWQWLKCTKICIMSITDSINFKVNLEIKKKRKTTEVGKILPYEELEWKESNVISQLMSSPGSPHHCGKWWWGRWGWWLPKKKKKIPTKNSFHLDPLNPLFFSPAWDTVSTGWTTLDQAWEL